MEKNKIVCDTDVLIDYLEIDKARHTQTKRIIEGTIDIDNIVLSIMSKMELAVGDFNKVELHLLNKNIHRFSILKVNGEISTIAMSLIEEYNLSHNLSIPDEFIAATAMHTGFKLFTYNTKDYKFISGLTLYEY